MNDLEFKNSRPVNEGLESALAALFFETGKGKEVSLISIAGIGASGKSILAANIAQKLGEDVAILETDDYLIPKAERRKLGITIGNPASIKLDRLKGDIERIKRKESIIQPVYYGNIGERMFIPKKYVILEGTWALAEEFQDLLDIRIFIECEPETQKARRFSRDTVIKGQTREEILALLHPRQLEFDHYIAPNKRYADIVLRSHPDFSMEILEDRLGLNI